MVVSRSANLALTLATSGSIWIWISESKPEDPEEAEEDTVTPPHEDPEDS